MYSRALRAAPRSAARLFGGRRTQAGGPASHSAIAALLASSASVAATGSRSAVGGAITPSISATQTSGPAPLGVVFDATASTSTRLSDNFRQMVYTFGYADSGSGNWTTGNTSYTSKNADVSGPIGAHVFKTPGTYVVSVGCNDGTESASTTVTVTVTDPNTVFSGTNTICISTSGNFADKPEGASELTQTGVVTSPVANRRYLYRAGETFTGTIVIPRSSTTGYNIQIGSFGTGARPIIRVEFEGSDPGITTWPENITIYGCQLQDGCVQKGSIRNYLVHDCLVPSSSPDAFRISDTLMWWGAGNSGGVPGNMYWSTGVVLSECVRVGITSVTGCWTEGMRSSAVIGCDFGVVDQHSFRMGCIGESFIGHNLFRGQSGDGYRHALKLHGQGNKDFDDFGGSLVGLSFDETNYTARPASDSIVIYANEFGSAADNNEWTISVGPQNDGSQVGPPPVPDPSPEGLRDIIIERNVCIQGTGTVQSINMTGLRFTYIDNTTPRDTGTGQRAGGLPPGWGESYFTSRA